MRDRRGLYSLVDWNTYYLNYSDRSQGRGLYSLVDWNVLHVGEEVAD